MSKPPHFIAIGSVLWDIIAAASQPMVPGSDIAGRIRRQPGGVALNIALELSHQGASVDLLTAIGKDPEGDALLKALPNLGTTHALRTDDPTDQYLAIEHPDGTVFGATADCHSLERAGTEILAPLKTLKADAIILDGNLPTETLAYICDQQLITGKTALVPASPGKALRLKTIFPRLNSTLYVNLTEANSLTNRSYDNAEVAAQALHEMGAVSAVVTDGANPAAQATNTGTYTVNPPRVSAISTTGAGDVFLATHLLAETHGQDPQSALLRAAQAATKHITKDQK